MLSLSIVKVDSTHSASINGSVWSRNTDWRKDQIWIESISYTERERERERERAMEDLDWSYPLIHSLLN